MLRISCLLVAGSALFCATTASAQDPLTAQLYGSGVHAFFSGDAKQAIDSLTAAIDGGSQDPRAYYFRGFAEMRLGQSQNATADFQKGAEMEGADMNGAYPVSKSLERIQGSSRSMLEKYRLRARIAAFQRKEGQRQMVYQKRRDADTQLLRQAGPPPSAAAVEMSAPAGADTGNPFGEAPRMTTVEKTGPAKAAEVAVPGAPIEADPFGGAAAPVGADPFGGTPPPTPTPSTPEPAPQPTAPPVVERPATPATPPPASGDDPFATPPPTNP